MRYLGWGIGLAGISEFVPLPPHAAAATRAAQLQIPRPKRWESLYYRAGFLVLGE